MGKFENLSDGLGHKGDAPALSDPAAPRASDIAEPHVRERMLTMAARYGLTEDDLADPYWREVEIVHACKHCKNAHGCARFLGDKRTSFLPEDDCPNAATYEEIAAERS